MTLEQVALLAGLPVAETAASMGTGKGAVRRYTARGMAALRPTLQHDGP
jgi:hypothetical protein